MPAPRAIMAAVSPEGVIGVAGKIPWHYRGDMRRVKRLTMGTTLIMGRVTWESLGGKPLPGRRNVVVSKTLATAAGADCFADLESAILASEGAIWFFGGARIYREAMAFSDLIDLVYVPDHVEHPDAVRFPEIDTATWEAGPLVDHEDEPVLRRQVFTRRSKASGR